MSLTNKDFNEIISGSSELEKDIWYKDSEKKYLFSVFSDSENDIIDTVNKKIILTPNSESSLNVSTFSDKNIINSTNIKIEENEYGEEYIKLELDDRIVTIIIDQSGSMTWNDSNGTRHVIAKNLVESINNSYPGNIKYNLIKYGSKYIDTLLFGLIDENITDINSINDLNSLYFSDSQSDFSKIRVVRNIERIEDGEVLTFPTSPNDGTIVSDGFFSSIFEENLDSETTYYYKIYTYNNDYNFSDGIEISVTPRERIIPRGVSIFRSLEDNDILTDGTALVGTGVKRDENTIGIWNFNEGEGNYIFDFSYNKINLSISDNSPRWIGADFVPSGFSGLNFNGISTYAINEEDAIFPFGDNNSFSVAAFVFPSSNDEKLTILSSYDALYNGFCLYIENGAIKFSVCGTDVYTDDSIVKLNRWSHIFVSYDGTNLKIYLNLEEQIVYGSIVFSSLGNPESIIVGGENPSGTNVINLFYGKITDLSVHKVFRDISYFNSIITVENQIDENTNEVIIDPENGYPMDFVSGKKVDNGDRTVIMRYVIPVDADYIGGGISIVRNQKHIPSWELDGDIIYSKTNVVNGIFYVTDVSDFLVDSNYFYRIFSKNLISNYSFPSDSPYLKIYIPNISNMNEIEVLSSNLVGPNLPEDEIVSIPGNKKIMIRWRNDNINDDRVIAVKIFHSNSYYPTVDANGGTNGTLIFTGVITDTQYVHRGVNNDIYNYYSIVNFDKYGRTSYSNLLVKDIASEDSDETKIPSLDIEDVRYEIYDDSSVGIVWKKPEKRIKDIDAFFDQSVVIYSSLVDNFGNPLPDDTLINFDIVPEIEKDIYTENVFSDVGNNIPFDDSDSYVFSIYKINNGIIRATLKMTGDISILSQIKSAKFSIRLKSYIPFNSKTSIETLNNISNNTDNLYQNVLNDIEEIKNETIPSENIFEYISYPINVSFTNPWQVEIVNRDKKKINHRCYYYKTTEFGDNILYSHEQSLNGIYIKSSSPFIARVKLLYKGEPITSGHVDAVIWDADVDLCSCAGSNSLECAPTFSKKNVSSYVSLESSTFPVNLGNETIVNEFGESETNQISYVDIPIYAPDIPAAIKLYIRSRNAGFASYKSLDIYFESILKIIDINSNSVISNGSDIQEQQCVVRIINPDNPLDSRLFTFPEDNSIVEWKIESKSAEEVSSISGGLLEQVSDVSQIERKLFSTDKVPLTNGVFSYTRKGVARNVFLGPIQSRNANIVETYEIFAKIVYMGLSDTARKQIKIRHNAKDKLSFGGRFLMEMEYDYKSARNNRLWTDGIDYKKIYISRNPALAETPDFKTGDVFRECVDIEKSSLFELSKSGQIVYLTSGDNDIEFLWGDISENIDAYTGLKYLERGEDSYISIGDASVVLNDSDVPDKTTVYVRCNKFCPDINCNKDVEKIDCSDINLEPIDITDCDLPLGNIYLSGETILFINGNPITLKGGGDPYFGVVPCPICYNEPLRIETIFTKVNNIDTLNIGSFVDENGNSILRYDSIIDIRVKVSFRNKFVPDGTLVYAVSNNIDGNNLFIALNNIVPTFTDTLSDGEVVSYADFKISARGIPSKDISETISIFSIYDENVVTERKSIVSFSLDLKVEEIIQNGGSVSPIDPIPIITKSKKDVYTKTTEKYDINDNSWDVAASLNNSRTDFFAESCSNDIYVMGGKKDNSNSIVGSIEKYDISLDSWEIVGEMLNPRFGGMSVCINEDIYIIGGVYFDSNNNIFRISGEIDVYKEDSSGRYWESLTSMPIINEGLLNEKRYGIAYGRSEHVVINLKNYIYVFCGINEIYDSSGKISIESKNDRILRYCIEDNDWEYTDVLLSNYLQYYQLISPLSISEDNRILVFNGALENNNIFDFPNEYLSFSLEEDILNTNIIIGDKSFGTIPLSKYKSDIVKFDSGSNGIFYYIFGGANDDSYSLDILERVNTLISPFEYENSDGLLSDMPIGKSGLKCCLVYDNETPYIYVIGGCSDGQVDNFVEIEFNI